MRIYSDATRISLPPDPTSLIEGSVTSTITSGIVFGSDPAQTLKTTVNNVLGVDPSTAGTLGPNFDRFSVLEFPQPFGVVGNLFQSGQDLVPIAQIASNFGGTFIGDELTQINVSNLLENPGTELSKFAKNVSRGLANEARQQGNSIVRGVVQDIKDVARGAVNSLLNPAAAKTTNFGVVDSRLTYAFFGPIDANKKYSKGQAADATVPVGFQGVEPIMNPHYVFRLNSVANGMSSGDEGAAQSRLLLDKEARMGVSKIGKRGVTLSAILSRFGGFSQKNPTPYRAADFLWLKYYNRIPLTRIITLRRYMFPIQDNLTRSPYMGGGTSRSGAWRIKGWANNPVSQMVTYFGADSGNDLSSIIKISVSSSWTGTSDSKVNDVEMFSGLPKDAISLFQSSRAAQFAAGLAKLGFSGVGGATKTLLGESGNKIGSFATTTSSAASGAEIDQSTLAAGVLAYGGLIDSSRFAGIRSYLDLFNPYESGGYLSDLYREPYNRILSAQRRIPGLKGGMFGEETTIQIKFEYSLKAIGHINAKAAMLDIMSNILATTHYRGNFWGGEARFYMNKGLFPLFDEKQTIEFVKLIWQGNFDGATQGFQEIIKTAFGNNIPTVDAIKALIATRDANTNLPSKTTDPRAGGTADTAGTAAENAAAAGGYIPEKLKDLAAIDLLAGMFGLTSGSGNASIPEFQALRTGAPVGEWHLTVGNPFKPIAVIGNLICEGVDISFNNELGPDDFPTEMTATVKLQQGMSRANQDIESVFNDGFGPMYIPKPDLFEGGKSFDQVKEEISKQVATGGVFDFMGFIPESTVESLSNFFSIPSNTDVVLPSPHIARPDPPKESDPKENAQNIGTASATPPTGEQFA